jgi:Ca2+-binding RTX toxin-like protein
VLVFAHCTTEIRVTLISTPQTVPSYALALTDGAVFMVTETGSISADTFILISGLAVAEGATTSLVVLGDLTAKTSIRLEVRDDDRLIIGPDAVIADAESTQAMLSASAGSSIVNSGTIYAAYGLVSMSVGGVRLTNHGEMVGQLFGVFAGQNGAGDRVTNHGSITVLGSNGQAASGHGVVFDSNNQTLVNSGTIEVFAANKSAVRINQPEGSAVITNTGTMIANAGVTISAQAGGIVGATQIANHGDLISGNGNFAIVLGDGSDRLVNTGRITGDVFMGGGADVIDLRGGTVIGSASGGSGNDVYRVADAGALINEVAGDGTDHVFARVVWELGLDFENLTLTGAAGIDGTGNQLANLIAGNTGRNALAGLGGNDTIQGGAGDDTLLGQTGNDRLDGGDGEDLLRGGLGRDSLDGGDDGDRLVGLAGADQLTSGEGHDVFVFQRVSDSGTTVAEADQITDFTRGRDLIDLSEIDANANAAGNNAFTFIGARVFSGVAGQLRATTEAGVTTIRIDVNGDRVADAAIRLTNGVTVLASDFVL